MSTLYRNRRRLSMFASYLVLGAFCVISVFPILWILTTALKPKEDVFSNELKFLPEHPTLDNFIYVLTNNDYMFLKWAGNSFLIATLTALICAFLASTAAYAFSRFKFPGRRQGLFVFMLVQMFPGIILIVPLYAILRNMGLLNSYTGLVLAYSTTALPFCVWMLKGFFDTIPVSLEEAARIDGLGYIGTYFRIILPLALPGFAITLFFAFITAWNEFMVAMTLMNQEVLYTLPVGIQTYVHKYNTDWHLMAAAGILITIPALLVFMRLQPMIISGLTSGATKS